MKISERGIQLVYFKGCPNVAAIETFLKREGLGFSMIDQEALPPNHPLKSYSSPTVIANGHVIFGSRTDEAALSCSLERFDAEKLRARLAAKRQASRGRR